MQQEEVAAELAAVDGDGDGDAGPGDLPVSRGCGVAGRGAARRGARGPPARHARLTRPGRAARPPPRRGSVLRSCEKGVLVLAGVCRGFLGWLWRGPAARLEGKGPGFRVPPTLGLKGHQGGHLC
jgi:hypothetical protein